MMTSSLRFFFKGIKILGLGFFHLFFNCLPLYFWLKTNLYFGTQIEHFGEKQYINYGFILSIKLTIM